MLEEQLARKFMVQCQNSKDFECPYLETCPHEDNEICQWQLDMADDAIQSLHLVQLKPDEDVFAQLDIILHPYIPKNVNPDNWLHDIECQIEKAYQEAGYVQLSENQEIPELTDEEITEVINNYRGHPVSGNLSRYYLIARAQRDKFKDFKRVKNE